MEPCSRPWYIWAHGCNAESKAASLQARDELRYLEWPFRFGVTAHDFFLTLSLSLSYTHTHTHTHTYTHIMEGTKHLNFEDFREIRQRFRICLLRIRSTVS